MGQKGTLNWMGRREAITGAAAALLAGCSQISGSNVQDSDGDGMIDSEDYAPSDPEVQEKSDLQGGQSNQNTPQPTSTPEQQSASIGRMYSSDASPLEGYMVSVGGVRLGDAEKIVVEKGDGSHLATFEENTDFKKIAGPSTDNGPARFGDVVVAYAVSGGQRTKIKEITVPTA